ncbi:MAG: hypothetical protein AAB439_00580 [Patescibacteria group bacterium]
MNAIFPDLLFLGPYFAPVLLRAGIGLYFLFHAYGMWMLKTQKSKLLAIKELAFALFFAAGLLTQLVAVFGILVVFLRGMWLGVDAPKEGWREKILAISILATLVLTGAGAIAFDLPY